MLERSIFAVFVAIASVLFVYLNHIHPYYFIDELFHVPQTLRYCHGKFFEWDPKITTLPGLYLITTAILGPPGLCNLMAMRSINLIATFCNVYLIGKIVKLNSKSETKDNWISLATTYSVALYPPLSFWFFLYYTDVLSMTAVLLALWLSLRRRTASVAVVGATAVLLRQTNIVWLALLAFERALDLVENEATKPLSPRRAMSTPAHVKFLWDTVKGVRRRGRSAAFIHKACAALLPYIAVGTSFLAFLAWNGGIVVGDRSAHAATIHVPQIFYFSVSTFCFAWPHMLPRVKDYIAFLLRRRVLACCALVAMLLAVHRNTLVHPYVLADNRHYIFYVWNRFLGRYALLRYFLVPFYGFTVYSLVACRNHLRFLSQVAYFGCVCAVIVPQLLLEPRYFIVPHVLFRLSLERPRPWQVAAELLTALVVNFLQFYVFASKVVYWEDWEYPQRIGW